MTVSDVIAFAAVIGCAVFCAVAGRTIRRLEDRTVLLVAELDRHRTGRAFASLAAENTVLRSDLAQAEFDRDCARDTAASRGDLIIAGRQRLTRESS
jgi:hypothetical protein